MRDAALRHHDVTLGERTIRYVDAGDGPVVVLVHGSPVSSFSFRHQIPALSRRFRVVAPDLLAFGGSAGPAGGASFPEQAAALRRLWDHLQLDAIRLVVHDWGGPIALGCAADKPQQLRQLVLMNTTFLPDFRPPRYWRPFVAGPVGELLVVRLNAVSALLPMLMRSARQRSVRRTYARPLSTERTRQAVLALEQLRGYRALMERVMRALPRMLVPTLLLWGEPDPYFRRRDLRRLQQRLPGATLHRLPGAGHFPQEDAPEATTAALEDFLEPE